MAFYTRARQEHWLHDKDDEGRTLILEDESKWEINPSDRSRVAHWLSMSTMTVEHTQTTDYPYLLTNLMEGETARANYLGEVGSRLPIPPEVA